ncbi:MAG: hypothetical protein R3E01_00590 [Pirellulaceae bacterium]|nr:hypothetical protein [Planctomycetales bacterium]
MSPLRLGKRLRRANAHPHQRRLSLEKLETRQVLATFVVTTNQDTVDADDGVVSLREAIAMANSQAGEDRIEFDLGSDAATTIRLDFGELTLTDAATIIGPGPALLTIDAQQQSRIFDIASTEGDYQFERLMLVNGAPSVPPFSWPPIPRSEVGGGAIRSITTGNLALENCVFQHNVATEGGAVMAFGNVRLYSSTITGNTGESGTGGVYTQGSIAVNSTIISDNASMALWEYSSAGGIRARGDVTVIDSTISNNQGDFASGISADGNIRLERSSVTDNLFDAVAGRGRIEVEFSHIIGNAGAALGAAEVFVTTSMISDNGSAFYAADEFGTREKSLSSRARSCETVQESTAAVSR